MHLRQSVVSTASGVAMLLLTVSASMAAEPIIVPSIAGLDVKVRETVLIPGANSHLMHQFDDGRIVVPGINDTGIWSTDGGLTWKAGPRGPDDKTVLNLGGGEVLSIYRTSFKKPDGTYGLAERRSPDNWKTIVKETALLDTPQATTTGGDAGDQNDGLLMHHGALRLTNGDLMATMYGNYKGDRIPADGYPEELNFFKVRTVVVFSSDNGRSWKNPVTVAYNRQLARGTDPDSSVQTTAVVPAVTQEGFGEADLVRAANGNILCVMRSGGRIGVRKAPSFPTPLYLSRSTDEGRTWTPPVAIADRGVSPNMILLQNGVIVCAYARPGGWLIFSDDNGDTWKGAFQFASSDSYCNLVEVAPNRILVLYYAGEFARAAPQGMEGAGYGGTFFTVERR